MSFEWSRANILKVVVGVTLLILALRFFGPSSAPLGVKEGDSLWSVTEFVPYSRPRGEAPSSAQSHRDSSPWSRLRALRPSGLRPSAQQAPESSSALSPVEKSEFTHESAEEEDSEEDSEWAETDEWDDEDLEDPLSDGPHKDPITAKKNLQDESKRAPREDEATAEDLWTGGGPQLENQDEGDEEALGLEDQLQRWTALLLQQPDFSALTQLVAEYQSGQISATVFYAVLDEMLADPREEVRQLAAIALVSTPGSSSFLRIADLLNQEAYNSPLRARLIQGLDYYKDLNYLVTLESVLWQSDQAHVLQLAAQQIQIAAQFHFVQERDLALDPNSSSEANPLTQRAVMVFSRFLPPLRELSRRQSDQSQELQLQTQSTLSSLEDFLSSAVSISQYHSLHLED